ncbi:MAG: hypothetical protein OQK82_01655 [Candidatus Pacearchaeota archaeon]|nr:hypothetical protein [Candidatus Pacearchaeota archaeon]
MNRKGQFYLLSAIVIISIIIGFSAISTYTKKTDTVRVFDLGDELEIESSNVLDYGTYNADEIDDLDEFLKNFTEEYAEYVGEDTEIAFIFGNAADENATVVNYEEIVIGDIEIGSSTITSTQRVTNESSAYITSNEGENIITIYFKGISYDMNLNPGENFYFVISQRVGDEVHTATSKEINQ